MMTEEILNLKKSRNEEDRKKCIELLSSYLKKHPQDSLANYYMASCYDFLGNEMEAEKFYQKSLEIGVDNYSLNDHRSFYVGFGSTLRNNLKFDRSIKVLKEGINKFPDYAPLKAFLALTFYSAKDFKSSSEVLFELSAKNSNIPYDGYEKVIEYYVDELKI